MPAGARGVELRRGKDADRRLELGGQRVAVDGKKTDVMARKITALPDWYKAGKSKPAGGRVTFTPWTFYQPHEALLDSGLLGPVRVVFADTVKVE